MVIEIGLAYIMSVLPVPYIGIRLWSGDRLVLN